MGAEPSLPASRKKVMVVNVNPYETGFDENSHVMKFSAVAKGVMTVKRGPDAVAADLMTLPSVPSLPIDFKIPEIKKAKPEPRLVRVSLIDNGDEEEVLYEGATIVLILSTFSARAKLTTNEGSGSRRRRSGRRRWRRRRVCECSARRIEQSADSREFLAL